VKRSYDLGTLSWQLAGFMPHEWRLNRNLEIGIAPTADIPATPAQVAGSVQGALRSAGLLPDWNLGLNARLCDWDENRHWIYETRLPDAWIEPGRTYRLHCLGLDYAGCLIDLEEYVAWGQERQAEALRIAASACKRRFPRCGGFIVWMGHDCFPCCANTSILDFDGRPKPAALALGDVWKAASTGS
jgi:hypothetical protein